MITNNGERNPNLGKSTKSSKSTADRDKKIASKSQTGQVKQSTPKTTVSSSTSGSLSSVSQKSDTPKSSSSSSSRSSGSSENRKKALSQAEKSAALSDLMNRETIGSSKYGLSFRSSANQQITEAEEKRKKSLVEQATRKDQIQGYNRTVSEYQRYQALRDAYAREQAKTRDEEKGRNRTSSELERQIQSINREISPYEDVNSERNAALIAERRKLQQRKEDVEGKPNILRAAGRAIEAGAGGFNSAVTSTLNAGRNALMQLESILNGGWDKETGKFVKGEAPAVASLLQPVADLDTYTKDTTAGLQKSAAEMWNQYGAGGNVANQLIQGTMSAVPNAVLAMATAGGSTATTLAPQASGMAATVTDAVRKLSSNPMYWTSFVQSFGNGYDEAIEKGASESEALLATLLSSTANAIVEIGGGVEQLPSEIRKEGLTSPEKFRKWVSSSLDEGKEEVIQGMIERLVNKAVYDQDAPWNEDEGEGGVFDLGQSAREFGMGAAIGGIMGGGQMLVQNAINARRSRIVDPTATPTDQAILDALRGVETPDNVTPVQETTALDDAIAETFMQGQSGITPDVATNKAKDVKNLLNATKEQITRFIQNAFNKQNQYKFLKISDVSPELVETLRTAGIEVEGYAHALRDNDLRHVDNSHGSKSSDKYKVTAEVMEQAQNIIDNYDNLYRGYDTKGGNPTVVYEKRMGNRTFYVEEVLDEGVLGTKQMVITGEDSKPSFLKKYTKIASVSGDTDVPALSGSKGISPPGNHVQDASYNTSYNPNVAQSYDSVNSQNQGTENDLGAAPAGFDPLSHASNQYGTIEPGENPTRVVDLPVSMDGETKVGKFARTAAEAKITTDEMVGRIEQLVQDGKLSHEVYSNKQAIEDGAAQIEKKYARGKTIDQIRSEFIRDANAGKAGAKFISQGTTLYADAIAEGNYNAASDILVALTAAETNAGQTVQAARLMKSMTPEGRIFTVQKMVSNLEAQINQKRSSNKQIELDIPDTLLDAYQNAATAETQETALQNIYQNVADQIPATVSEGLQQWRYFSMLANPSTHAKNIIGNVGGTVAKIGKDNIAALAESVIIGDREKRAARKKQTSQASVAEKYGLDTNTAENVAAITNGWELPDSGTLVGISNALSRSESARRAIIDLTGQELSGNGREISHKIREIYRNNQSKWKAKQESLVRTKAFLNPLSKADQNLINMGWADYDNAVDLYEDSVGKYSNSAGEINDKRRYWKINDPQNAVTRGIDKALGKLEKVNDFNSKALEAEDMLFSKPMYSVALAGYMKANHLTEITDAARNYAMSEAKRATYNDINSVSKWATSLGKGSKLGRFLSGTIYPFKKVPANVMVRTVEYSPLGYLKGMNDIIQMSRGNTDITVAKTIDDFAAATAGTALLGVGAMLAKQGILRATGVGDDKEKEQQKNAFGAKDFSILIGDTYVPIDSFTLSGTGLLTGAQIWEAAQNARNGDAPISFEDFLDALSKITDPVFEQSMLSGMDSILSTIQNSGDAGTGELMTRLGVQVIGNYVGQYVPTVIGRTAASFDQYQRSTYVEPDGAWSPVQSAVQGVQKKLPGLREDMAASYGNWGVPVKGNGADGFLVGAGKAVTPVYTSQKKTDAVEEEIARLHDENAEYSNFYTRPAKSIAVGGETIKLTSEQYAKYVEARGQTDYNTRADMLESEIYKSLPDNVKSKAMSLSQEYATAIGKEAAGVGYENDTAWINDLKGKSQEEITKAILGRAIDAEGGLGTADAKDVYSGTQYAGLSGEVMDASLEYAKQYESALEKEKLGYPIEDGWISEAKELTDKERTDLFIKKATEKLSNSMGGSKYENLGTMLDEGTINDAAVYASLSKDDVDRYMEVGQGKIGTDKLLDAMRYFNSDECKSEKDANGNTIDGKAQVDNYVNWLNGTGWSDKEKAAAYLQEYTGLKDMPEAWLDAVDEDMVVGAIGKDDLAKWEELGKDTASAQNVLRASYQYDTLTADKDENGKTISGSKQQKYIDWLDSTDMAESEKRTLFLLHYTEKKCPYGTGEDGGSSVSSGSVSGSNAAGTGISGAGYASSAASGSGYASNRELTQAEKAYERFGKAAGATQSMYDQAKSAMKGIETVYDMDGNIVRSAEDQFDSWLERQGWTQDQKDAVRAGFYADSVKNLQWLSNELREGNISVAAAKSELSPRMQTGWSRNVLDTGASMAEYIDAFAQFKQAPNADERKAMGYSSKWAWFCDYLNSTDMTAEQKYATAASVQDYASSTLKKIAKALGYTPSEKEAAPQEETYDLRTDDGYRAYLSLLLGRTKRYEAADGSIWTVSSDGEVLAKRKDGRVLRVRAILGKNGFDDEAGDGYTVSSRAGVLAYKMMQNGVMKTWDAPDGWTWKLSRWGIIAEKNGTKLPVRYAG